jgi:hypothetical protein
MTIEKQRVQSATVKLTRSPEADDERFSPWHPAHDPSGAGGTPEAAEPGPTDPDRLLVRSVTYRWSVSPSRERDRPRAQDSMHALHLVPARRRGVEG